MGYVYALILLSYGRMTAEPEVYDQLLSLMLWLWLRAAELLGLDLVDDRLEIRVLHGPEISQQLLSFEDASCHKLCPSP
jgi:hypothetical protein